MGKKEKPRQLTYGEEMALTEVNRPGSPAPVDQGMLYSLGRSVYMIMDPEVTSIIDPRDKNGRRLPSQLRSLLPAFSHLNRVSKIGSREADLLELDYEYLMIIHKLNMNEEEFESKGWAELESLKIFARHMINDAFGGWKGNLITEHIKVIKTELKEEKKSRWPF